MGKAVGRTGRDSFSPVRRNTIVHLDIWIAWIRDSRRVEDKRAAEERERRRRRLASTTSRTLGDVPYDPDFGFEMAMQNPRGPRRHVTRHGGGRGDPLGGLGAHGRLRTNE